jgi:hypothetical protein
LIAKAGVGSKNLQADERRIEKEKVSRYAYRLLILSKANSASLRADMYLFIPLDSKRRVKEDIRIPSSLRFADD